ncbi:TPA: sulfite exporter TauE/SafE family protein [candidate division WOR-3]|uniref:Probable membrane transporter protein n=2 Tax=Bacteria candidate phyla TaxID=1783234 RepID=A0A124FZV8_UNCT6|nr:MAG: Putative permease [candidate division TA06 bacterium 34_109]HAF08257.1 sulfite exporter TauE/SafE family protein [candidate division WOR-3 bacterium]HCP16666.1 sulfite exporter TauE/SafE family protein [candidate division WOR-3 bacterium]
MKFLILIPVGFIVGTVGTLIGAGGGFLLMPFMMLYFSNSSPKDLTAISMIAIFFNSLSGTYAYMKMKRVEIKTAIIFSLITIPGSIVGTIVTNFLDRKKYNLAFGIFLILIVIFLLFFKKVEQGDNKNSFLTKTCFVKDSSGNEYNFSYNLLVGLVISFFVGFLSPIFGIGGGVLHVPFMIKLLCFPPHIATATSHFVLMVMSFVSVLTHIFSKVDRFVLLNSLMIIIGIIPGAQLGAKLSKKVHGNFLLYFLSFALFVVALRILFLKG